MRKFLLAAAGAMALLGGTTTASAAVVVTSTGTLNNPVPLAIWNPVTRTYSIDFGTNPITTSPYSTSFSFLTDSQNYSTNFTADTSSSDGSFFEAMVDGPGLPVGGLTFGGIGSHFVSLFGVPLAENSTYTVTVGLSNATAFTGNATSYPVPEPATWGMMLLGFGGIGLVMRRGRRKTVPLTA